MKFRPVSAPAAILGSLVLGGLGGFAARWLASQYGTSGSSSLDWILNNIAKPAGDIFMALLFMVVVPLIFSALVLGMQELSVAKKFGRVGSLSLALTVAFSIVASGVGIVGANLIKPGHALPIGQRQEIISKYESKEKAAKSLSAATNVNPDPPVLGIIPKNPIKEMGRALEGGLLPLMFFALVFGGALASVESETAKPLRDFLEALFAVSQKVIEFAMKLAPIAVFFLVFKSCAEMGTSLLTALGGYVLTVIGLLAIVQFAFYGLAVRVIAKRNPLEYFKQLRTTIFTAFATSSSNATLPTALRDAEEQVGLSKEVSSFVLTVGATANQNGTALFEGVAILFLAQLFGRDLTTAEQIRLFGLTVVSSIGTAGIPAAAIPFIATVLASLNIPVESIGLILGVDRLLDMCRTVLNVTGDVTIATCVDRLTKAKKI